MLVLALGAILALISVPAIDGWMAESRLSAQADDLIVSVQSAKILAEKTGKAQIVTLKKGPASAWIVGPDKKRKPVSEIKISDAGLVDPVFFRVEEGSRFVEYRFDFLTGHAHQLRASF